MRLSPFLFGKVPDRGDFVRAGPLPPLFDELDGWLQRGLLPRRQAFGPSLGGAPPVGFVLGRPDGVLLGAFAPSRDRVGRLFPLVAGAAAGGAAEPMDGGLLAREAPFLRTAVACAREVAAGSASLEHAMHDLDAAPEATDGAGDLLGRAPSDVFGARPVDVVVERLGGVLHPLRGGGPPLRYGLGLPLPANADTRPHAAGFWLDAALRAAGPLPAVSLLWTAAGEPARLALFLGSPTTDALAYLLASTPAEGVYDLDHDPATRSGTVPPAAEAPSLRALLDRL